VQNLFDGALSSRCLWQTSHRSSADDPHERVPQISEDLAELDRKSERCVAGRINGIVHGKPAITAHAALRRTPTLGLSDKFFINMSAHCDAEIAANTWLPDSPLSTGSPENSRDIPSQARAPPRTAHFCLTCQSIP
jgi:hypothetical protein